MAEKTVKERMSRRKALGYLAAAPAAAAMAPAVFAQLEDTGFTDLDRVPPKRDDVPRDASNDIKCLVKGERELSRSERKDLVDDLTGLQEALDKIRTFELADDVAPALEFRPLGAANRSRS